MKHEISEGMLAIFRKKMMEEEKAAATVEKYTRDVGAFLKYAEDSGGVDKELVLTYKSSLAEKYTPVSVNSMLAALNCFFKKTGWFDCTVKLLKIQKESFRAPALRNLPLYRPDPPHTHHTVFSVCSHVPLLYFRREDLPGRYSVCERGTGESGRLNSRFCGCSGREIRITRKHWKDPVP